MNEEVSEMRSDVNKYGIYLAIPLFCIAGAIYYFGPQKPCVRPITYYVRTVNSDFGITTLKAEKIATEAASIWNTAAGRELFIFDQGGKLPIDFVYDERQKLSTEATKLESTLGSTENKITDLKLEYQAKEREYEKRLAAYNSNLEIYNQNRTKEGYDRLIQEQALLTEDAARIKSLISEHNQLVEEVNKNIEKYNSNPLIGREFEAGLYTEDSSGKRIDIYEYKNDTELLRLITHELGHALTIDHNDNPESIMYSLNTGKSIELSAEDFAALKEVCRL